MATPKATITKPSTGTMPAALWGGAFVLGFLALSPGHVAASDIAGFRNPTEQRDAVVDADRGLAPRPRRADFAQERPSHDVRYIANWVAHSSDNGGLPFLIVDKTNARVFVFDAGGSLRGAAPVLLGAARGDHSVPGIGERHMSRIRPHERTTPAGRFVAERGRNLQGEDIVWVDYDSAVSLHRVRATNPRERRLERLASPTPADNRISYGCINVPATFYETLVRPAFAAGRAIVYVLPEVRAVREVFGSYDVGRVQPLDGSSGIRPPRVARASAQP